METENSIEKRCFGRIFIVEDNANLQCMFAAYIKSSEIIIIPAKNLATGEELFHEYNGEFDFIAVDACLESKHPDSMELIKHFLAAGFTGEIIAISNSDEFNDELIKAGATRKVLKDHFVGVLVDFAKKYKNKVP